MAKLELPDDLSNEMEVLFVNPYNPEESKILRLSGASDADLTRLFHEASARDPGFQKFEDKVALLKTTLNLGGYLVGDDLIILYGNREALQKAHDALKDEYTCFFDTVGAFLEHTQSEDAVVVIEQPKPTFN